MKVYRNPIKKRGDFADPFVLRHNGKYYLYCTNPDVRCWSSRDLVEWRLEGPVISADEFPGLVPFAPEVVYWNGAFYMYTSPHGLGHYVLRSDTPTGPFRKITGNIGHNIDLSIFIDDDGQWYAYWADERGIMGCKMASPTEFGPERMVGAYMHGWTEGPFVVKENGTYHLTYTGNHFLSKGYRIHTAVSDSPLGPFRDSGRNPAIVRTCGGVVGLGHSSTVIGPDLRTHYIVYHNLNPDRTRDLDIDPVLLTEKGAYVLGPTETDRPAPIPAEYQDFFDGAPGEEWSVSGSGWAVEDGMRVSKGAFSCLCSRRLPGTGTAEFHLAAAAEDAAVYGVFFRREEDTIRVEIDRSRGLIIAGDGSGVLCSAPLPDGYRHEALHQIRLRFGSAAEIFLDQVRALRLERPLGDCRFGYYSGGRLKMGSVAYSRAASDIPACPVPCALPPMERFRVQADREGSYAFSFIGVGVSGDSQALEIDGKRIEAEKMQGDPAVKTFGAVLASGVHDIRVGGCRPGFDHLLVYERFPEAEERLSVCEFGPYEKRCGGKVFCDLELNADIEAGWVHGDGQAGILFRAGALADGGEGTDKILGTNFFVGYRVALEDKRVGLWRHRYDEVLLAEHPGVIPEKCTVRIAAAGGRISVWINGKEIISYCDEAPILWGGVGFHARNCIISAAAAARETPQRTP